MVSKWGIIFLCALSMTSAQNGYSRESPSNQLNYDAHNQGYSNNDDELHGDEIPGEAGRDYPIYSEVPETGFDCHNQQFPGYYADPEAQCQAFYICQKGDQSDGFLCPNGTVFNQQYLVCDWWYNFDCSQAEELYSINEQIVQAMQEADARLSQQQDGYNYNTPERHQNEGGHSGRYSGPQPTRIQNPSAVYGVPSRNGNGGHNSENHGNNYIDNGRPQNGGHHGGAHSESHFSGQNAPNAAYGVPSGHGGNSLRSNGNGRYQGGGNGGSNGKLLQNNNGFNGRNGSPRPVYGVPSSSNRDFSQYNSNNGQRFNGQIDFPRSEYGVPSKNTYSSQYNTDNEGHNGVHSNQNGINRNFNGNTNSPKQVYGVPTSGNNGHENGFNGNQHGNTGFGGNFNGNVDSPKPVYGVPSGNGVSGSDSNGSHDNGFNGNRNGDTDLIETLDVTNEGPDFNEPLKNGPSSPERAYGVPNGASHGPSENGSSHGNSHSAELNGKAPDRSYLPSQ